MSIFQRPSIRLRLANSKTQNFEGWNRCALSFESIEFLPSTFMIRYSLFYRIRKNEVFFQIKLVDFQANGGADLKKV